MRIEQGRQQLGLEERHVAVHDQDLLNVVGQAAQPGQERIGGAPRLVLAGEVGDVGEGVADGLGRWRVDDQRTRPGHRRGGLEHVAEHRPAAQLVEDLGKARLHPRPESGGEDDRDGPDLGWFGLHQG